MIDALSEDDLEYMYQEYKEQPHKRRRTDANEISLGDEDAVGDIMDPNILIRRKIEENNPKIDNLYLDMNGIIHPCCHPLDRPAPSTEQEMFNLIFEYIDKVVGIVDP